MDLPFTVLGLKPPRLRKPPTVSRPSSLQVFSLVFVGYFLIVSGIIYDVIQEPPRCVIRVSHAACVCALLIVLYVPV